MDGGRPILRRLPFDSFDIGSLGPFVMLAVWNLCPYQFRKSLAVQQLVSVYDFCIYEGICIEIEFKIIFGGTECFTFRLRLLGRLFPLSFSNPSFGNSLNVCYELRLGVSAMGCDKRHTRIQHYRFGRFSVRSHTPVYGPPAAPAHGSQLCAPHMGRMWSHL